VNTLGHVVEARGAAATHGIEEFARSFLAAFGGVAICIGAPVLWMIVTLTDRTDLSGQMPVVVLGLVLTIVGLPVVGALCASRGLDGAWGGLVGVLAAAGMWAAAGTAASGASGTQRVFADFVPTFVIMAIVASLLFMVGLLASRRTGARRT
jgi:hypothetical protein